MEQMQLSMKAARVNANLTQEEAAIAIGIGRSTLQSYEAGKCIPKIDVAKRMAKTYKLSVDNIIFLPNECA